MKKTKKQNAEKDNKPEVYKWEGLDEVALVKQVQQEYDIAYKFMKPKIDEWILRLKLLNNQKRDKKDVGDPILFTIMFTVMSSLSSDRLEVEFAGTEEGDDDQAENLMDMAEYDYEAMELDMFFYLWNFAAGFFGRALAIMTDFDTDSMLPVPELVNMLTWLRDPDATSVNGDKRGRGQMRYGGREICLTTNEMRNAGTYHNFEDLKNDTSEDTKSLYENARRAQGDASGTEVNPKTSAITVGDNVKHRMLEWVTHYNGNKVLVTLGENRTKIVRYRIFKSKKWWPIADRTIYPYPDSWDGVSIPDLIEDKQRARSVMQNLAIRGAKADLNPMYVYNTNKIKNRASLNYGFNKHIGVEGDPNNVIAPIERRTVTQEAQWVLEQLKQGAEMATAANQQQQGMINNEKRTATEINDVAQKADRRFSLSAMIFGHSDRKFWQMWYDIYEEFFADKVYEKAVRISGASGHTFKKLTRDQIIFKEKSPDIRILSRAVSEQAKYTKLIQLRAWVKDVLAIDQNVNYRFALKLEGKLSGLRRDEINGVMPPNYDELKAEDENSKINEGKMVEVDVDDDDLIHMDIHQKAEDGKTKEAHIKAHKDALLLKKKKPEFANNKEMNTPDEMGKIAPPGNAQNANQIIA